MGEDVAASNGAAAELPEAKVTSASKLAEAVDPDVAAEEAAIVIDPWEVLTENGGPQNIEEETGLPRVLRSYVVFTDPPVWVIPQFLSDAEVEHLIEVAEDKWTPSEVGRGTYKTNDETKDLSNKISPIRTSYSSLLRTGQTNLVRNVEYRLAQVAGLDVDFLEPLNMVRYEPGQFFKQHHDGRFRPKTVFLYLNDLPPDAGGETFFPELGIKVKPRRGCAVMWNNTLQPQQEDKRLVHQGLAPKAGVKYGVNCFFNDKSMRNLDVECQDDRGPWHSLDGAALLGEEADGPRSPDELFTYKVLEEPEMHIIPSALSAEELNALIAQADGGSKPSSNGGMNAEFSDILPKVQTKLAALAEMPAQSICGMRLSKCSSEEFPADGRDLPPGVDAQRPWRCIHIFLNTVPDGGQLRFPRLAMEVLPQAGCATLWMVPNAASTAVRKMLEHRGRPPSSGFRYIAVCWLQEKGAQ